MAELKNFKDWSSAVCELFPQNGSIAVMAGVHAVLSDEVYEAARCQPILALYGPPASGKSTLVRCIKHLLNDKRHPYYGAELRNPDRNREAFSTEEGCVVIEELDNSNAMGLESLKATWDRAGYRRGILSPDYAVETHVMRATLIVTGTNKPSDHPFRSRCIEVEMRFAEYTNEGEVNRLRMLTADFDDARHEIRHAALMTLGFTDAFQAANERNQRAIPKLNPRRLERNIATYLALHGALAEHLAFAFTAEQLQSTLISGAIAQEINMGAQL